MKIYCLTSIGNAVASNPIQTKTPAVKILYALRRHGLSGSDEWLKDQLRMSGEEFRQAINTLLEANAIKVIGGKNE